MNAPSAGPSILPLLILLAIDLFLLISLWKVYTKASRPGWACLIPIYNIYVMLKMAGKPGWWLILLLIPLVNFIFIILWMIALANQFGKSGGFAMGLVFLPFIFFPILAFGGAQYQPAAA